MDVCTIEGFDRFDAENIQIKMLPQGCFIARTDYRMRASTNSKKANSIQKNTCWLRAASVTRDFSDKMFVRHVFQGQPGGQFHQVVVSPVLIIYLDKLCLMEKAVEQPAFLLVFIYHFFHKNIIQLCN